MRGGGNSSGGCAGVDAGHDVSVQRPAGKAGLASRRTVPAARASSLHVCCVHVTCIHLHIHTYTRAPVYTYIYIRTFPAFAALTGAPRPFRPHACVAHMGHRCTSPAQADNLGGPAQPSSVMQGPSVLALAATLLVVLGGLIGRDFGPPPPSALPRLDVDSAGIDTLTHRVELLIEEQGRLLRTLDEVHRRQARWNWWLAAICLGLAFSLGAVLTLGGLLWWASDWGARVELERAPLPQITRTVIADSTSGSPVSDVSSGESIRRRGRT